MAHSAVKVGGLLSEIADASSEQAQGIEQVNLAVNEMDRVVQQNSYGSNSPLDLNFTNNNKQLNIKYFSIFH